MLTRATLDDALASGWFGAGLPDAARARLADLAGLTAHPAGAVVMREGAPVDSLGVVVDGRLAIRLNVPGRGVVTVLTVEPGDFIGWSALVAAVSSDLDRRGPRADERRDLRGAALACRARRRPGPGRARLPAGARGGGPAAGGHADPAPRPVRPGGARTVVTTGPPDRRRPIARWLPAADLDRLLDALRADGRTIIGPTVRDEAIVLDEILSADDLPAGWGAEASARPLSADAARRRAPVRPCRRADVLEALDVPAAGTDPARAAHAVGRPLLRRRAARRPRSRSSASGPARSPRSRSRTASCSTVRRSTPTIAPGGPRRSSSRSSARRPPRPASAPRWGPGPR